MACRSGGLRQRAPAYRLLFNLELPNGPREGNLSRYLLHPRAGKPVAKGTAAPEASQMRAPPNPRCEGVRARGPIQTTLQCFAFGDADNAAVPAGAGVPV